MMTKKWISTIAIMIGTLSMAGTLKDSDLDGVPNEIDACPNTPLFNQVNSQGCTTKILRLPQESDTNNLTLTLGHGYNTNEDLIERERQEVTKIQLSFYHDTWSYSLKTGYYSHHKDRGLQDSILQVKKRFNLKHALKLNLGMGLKLPSYDFKGNKTDYTLYGTLYHYATSSLSYFTGMHYTFVRDDAGISPLQNSYSLYLGSGYFFTNHFYANLSYSYSQSKYKEEETFQTLASTLYYKINKKIFTTATYQHEIGDEDLHDGLIIKLGYKFW